MVEAVSFVFSCKTFAGRPVGLINLKDLLLNARKSPLDNAYKAIFPNIRNFDSVEEQLAQLEQLTLADIQNLYNSKLVILESNHDVSMLKANPNYSFVLKNRILGKRGHLSNDSACEVVADLVKHQVKQVVLAHLSPENNTPELCYNTMCDYLLSKGILPNVHIYIEVADKTAIGTVYNLK